MADLRALSGAIRLVMLNATAAGGRVSSVLPERPTLPYITYRLFGGPGAWDSWSQGETTRVRTIAWAEYEGDAMDLHTEIRDLWLPFNSNPVQGFVGTLTPTVDGAPRTVHIDGVQMNAGPNPDLDPPTNLRIVECYWLVNWY